MPGKSYKKCVLIEILILLTKPIQYLYPSPEEFF